MANLLRDLSYSLRKLINRPSFTLVIVITLGLSIGANTAIFSVVDAVLLRPLPYRDADRLVKVYESVPQKKQSKFMVSLGDFNEWKNQSQSFEDMTALAYVSFRVAGPTTEEVLASRVSTDFFTFLGVTPALGRTFLAEDANATTAGVVVLTHGYWVSHFGADRNVINSTLILNDKPHIIVGVLPPNFYQSFDSYPGVAQVWTPVSAHNEDGTRTGPGAYHVIARLKPGVTIEQARTEMLGVSDRLAQTFPKTNTGVVATVHSLHEEVTNTTRKSLLVLFAAVGFVLLIACANIANILLARSVERSREVAVRLAIGASRTHIIRQLLIESLMLSVVGGALGWFIATWILRAIVPLIPPDLPRANEIAVDYRSLLFTLGISVLATLLFGLSPALSTARVSLTDALKNSGRTATDNLRSRHLRQGLIVLQLALTTVLLVGAGLLTNSLVRFYRVDPGFETRNLLSMGVRLPRTGRDDPGQWNVFWSSLLDSARRVPGTTGVALAAPMPLGESRYTMNVGFGAANGISNEKVVVGYSTVSANYFQTLGIRLLYGREFTADDGPQSAPVIVVNERFADVYFSNQRVLGKAVLLNRGLDDEKLATVIGVVADSRARLDEQTAPHVYQAMTQFAHPSMYLLARNPTNEMSFYSAMRTASAALDPRLALTEQGTMDRLWAEYTVRPRFYLSLIAGLASLGLTLATVGIYGLLSHNVSQLTHEIGIRRALGARDAHLLRIVVLQGMMLSFFGVVGGLIIAAFTTRLIREWLFEVGVMDFSTFAIVGFSLMLIALIACYFPARRATEVDPLVALRYE